MGSLTHFYFGSEGDSRKPYEGKCSLGVTFKGENPETPGTGMLAFTVLGSCVLVLACFLVLFFFIGGLQKTKFLASPYQE